MQHLDVCRGNVQPLQLFHTLREDNGSVIARRGSRDHQQPLIDVVLLSLVFLRLVEELQGIILRRLPVCIQASYRLFQLSGLGQPSFTPRYGGGDQPGL